MLQARALRVQNDHVRRIDRIAANLKAARKRQRHSQYTLADASGVSRGTIANIERGANADVMLETLQALALALGMTVEDLTGEMDRPTPTDLLELFLASDYGQDAEPTPDEIEWLRTTLETLSWNGRTPGNRTLSLLLQGYRSLS